MAQKHISMAFVLLCVALLAGSVAAQNNTSGGCNPDDALLQADFLGLATPAGKIECKNTAKVNLTDVLGKLTSQFDKIRPEDLDKLPGLISILLAAPTSALRPLLSLSAEQFRKLLPVLTQVPTDKLAGTLQILSGLPDRTLTNQLLFLRTVTQPQIERLLPAFERLTTWQTEILRKALWILPDHAWDFLVAVIYKLTPATDLILAPKLSFLPPIRIEDNKYVVKPVSPPDTKALADKYYGDFNRKAWSAPNCSDDVAGEKGLELSAALDPAALGPLACKFGPEKLQNVLNQTLTLLGAQHPDTIKTLPELTELLVGLSAEQLAITFQIPQDTLRRLIPVLAGLPADKVQFQLTTLANESTETLNKLIFFVNKVSYTQITQLVPFFSKINEHQTYNMAKFLGALSPGQIFLTLRLLDFFGFAMNPIGDLVGLKLDTFAAATNRNSDGTKNPGPAPPRAVNVNVQGSKITATVTDKNSGKKVSERSIDKKKPTQVQVKVGTPEPYKPNSLTLPTSLEFRAPNLPPVKQTNSGRHHHRMLLL